MSGGRIEQARARARGVARRQMALLAEHVANGLSVKTAGERLGLTKGQTARTWANIKDDLGWQAAL